jgi:hypothetical protein
MTATPNKSACKLLSNGKYVYLDSLTDEDIDLSSISQSLNQIKRFTGHYAVRPPLTVAQHTYLVYNISKQMFPDEPLVHLDCVLHDFGEAFYGDIASPVKSLIKHQFKLMATPINTLIYSKFYPVEYTEDVYNKRVICDLIALDIERRQMWKPVEGDEQHWPPIPEYQLDAKEMFDQAYYNAGINLGGVYKEALENT